MPSISNSLTSRLARSGSLERAVETGTYMGDGARRLAVDFPEVVTIEVSPEFAASTSQALATESSITVLEGHSLDYIGDLAAEDRPTLFFLDGHWSGGTTGGAEDECPVVGELEAIASGLRESPVAIVIDDARLFAAPPPAPHDPAKWPTLMDLFSQAVRLWPDAYVTVLDDQVIIVSPSLRSVVEEYGQALSEAASEPGSTGLRARLRSRLSS